jgi:hypothetical protein
MPFGSDLPPLFKGFFDFYQSLPRGVKNNISTKDSLKMAEMVTFLPYYFLVKRVDKNTLINKIIGTSVDETLGHNFTNENVFNRYKGDKKNS